MATNDLIAMVREKQTQIAKLQAELDEVRKLLLGPISSAPAAPREAKTGQQDRLPGFPVIGKRGRRRRKSRESSVTLAAAVVTDGGALHVDEMIKRIAARFGKEVDKQTLVSNLARLAKRGDEWERTAPNTFGLKKAS